MRALWIDRWGGPLLSGERPSPEAREGEVLVQVDACAIGLTVLNCIRGDLGAEAGDLPRVPGHELVGRIVDCGPGVSRRRIGEAIGAYFYLFCGNCPSCLGGEESMCERLGGFVGVNRDGGYAELAALPARNAVQLPEELDPEDAVVVPDAVATAVHVARRAAIGPSDRVVVIAAAGGVGIHTAQVARVHGAQVIGLEATPEKLAYLEDELGIAAVDSSNFERAELPSSWSPGPDVIVDLLGTDRSLRWSHESLGPGGRMVTLTTFPGVEFAVSPRRLVFTQGSVLGSRYASRREVVTAARMVVDGRVRPIVSSVVSPEQVEGTHGAIREGRLLGRAALRWR